MIRTKWLSFCLLLIPCVVAYAQLKNDQTRGELLYSTHCNACHTEQVHWRDKKLATDWGSLKGEVRHWAEVAGLNWGEDELIAVALYLNPIYYHFPASDDDASMLLRRKP